MSKKKDMLTNALRAQFSPMALNIIEDEEKVKEVNESASEAKNNFKYEALNTYITSNEERQQSQKSQQGQQVDENTKEKPKKGDQLALVDVPVSKEALVKFIEEKTTQIIETKKPKSYLPDGQKNITFSLDEEVTEKLRDIAYHSRLHLREIMNEISKQYIIKYEKTHGEVPARPTTAQKLNKHLTK